MKSKTQTAYEAFSWEKIVMTHVRRKASMALNISTEQRRAPFLLISAEYWHGRDYENGRVSEGFVRKRIGGSGAGGLHRLHIQVNADPPGLLLKYLTSRKLQDTDHAELVFRSMVRLIPYCSIHYSKCEIKSKTVHLIQYIIAEVGIWQVRAV